MRRIEPAKLWKRLRPVLPPLLLGALVFFTLREPLEWWLYGEEKYDQEALKEWLREARIHQTLPELARDYVSLAEELAGDKAAGWPRPKQEISGAAASRRDVHTVGRQLEIKREEIFEHLQALGNPPTRMYRGQLPLFPLIYRLTIRFDAPLDLPPIVWDSEQPRHKGQYRLLDGVPVHERARVDLEYHLHAYSQRQAVERQEVRRRLWLSGLGLVFFLLAVTWIYLGRSRERERQKQRLRAEQQMNEAERLRLHEELRRQEAERLHQEAERQNLELKSQLFANIGIMAGSYAHNIKNLLVRPNDLLRRCLEDHPAGADQHRMLHEVRHTLGTVTERLQQILQTVRRDPSRSERLPINLNQLLVEMHHTWSELAREKWKLTMELDLCREDRTDWEIRAADSGLARGGQARLPVLRQGRGPAGVWIEGDLSHLQQAFENLLFNARDATFEMRNQLRDRARQRPGEGANREATGHVALTPRRSPELAQPSAAESERRQALLAAAAWKGHIVLRSRQENNQAIIEIQDNGVGMTEEVRRRCTETHFSTKRNNALFAGFSAGMGLGLSFVTVILEHHQARMEIDSEPFKGTTFRVRFPLLKDSKDDHVNPF